MRVDTTDPTAGRRRSGVDASAPDARQDPAGAGALVYYSSASGNTERFMERLGLDAWRIPISPEAPMPEPQSPFVLVCPSYADAILGVDADVVGIRGRYHAVLAGQCARYLVT